MHSHRRPRAGILFEVLCAFTIGASFVLAWRQTGAWAFLGSASAFALLGLYWSLGLFARKALAAAAEPTAEAAETEVPATFQGAIAAEEDVALATGQVEVLANAADVLIDPEPLVDPEPLLDPEPLPKPPPKRRARKPRAAKAVVEATPAVPVYEPAPSGPPIEQLFEPPPFARQIRPAFGRRAGGSKKLTA